QEELQNDGPLPREVVLEASDVGEPLVPDALAHEPRGKPLPLQDLLVHAHDEDLFVVGAVEDANAAALRKALNVAPQEAVAGIRGGGLLEGGNLTSLRIPARHDVLDRAVLAGGVHRLEDEQQRPAVLRIEHLLLLGEPLGSASQEVGRLALLQLQAKGIAGVDAPQLEALALRYAKRLDEFPDAIEDLSSRHGRAFPPGAS